MELEANLLLLLLYARIGAKSWYMYVGSVTVSVTEIRGMSCSSS